MKIYIVFDTDGYVHGAYRDRAHAIDYLIRLYDKMDSSPNFIGVGRAKSHVWWNSDGEEHHVIMQEVELR